MSTSYQTINAFENDKIFYLEVNRPDELNALNKVVLDELLDDFQTKAVDVFQAQEIVEPLPGFLDKRFFSDLTGGDVFHDLE